MNDLGVAYRVIETLNARNEITDLKLLYEIRARGAGADSGPKHAKGSPRQVGPQAAGLDSA